MTKFIGYDRKYNEFRDYDTDYTLICDLKPFGKDEKIKMIFNNPMIFTKKDEDEMIAIQKSKLATKLDLLPEDVTVPELKKVWYYTDDGKKTNYGYFDDERIPFFPKYDTFIYDPISEAYIKTSDRIYLVKENSKADQLYYVNGDGNHVIIGDSSDEKYQNLKRKFDIKTF